MTKPGGMIDRALQPHQPEEACGNRHCWSHDIDEPAPPDAYQVCFECRHVYPTEQDLVDAYNKVVAEINADGAQRYGAAHQPRPPKTSAADIYFCQFCMHDF